MVEETQILSGLLIYMLYEFLAILSESMATDRHDARAVAETLPHPVFGKRERETEHAIGFTNLNVHPLTHLF